METEKTLTLLKPVTFAKEQITELQLSEPIAGDLVKASKAGNDLEGLLMLIHLNAKVLPGAVALLGQRDLQAAGAFFATFDAESTATSNTSDESSQS